MILGSADILLDELVELLTARQATVLLQVAVCRAPMTLDDLSFALSLARRRRRQRPPAARLTWRCCALTSCGSPISPC